MAEILEEGTAAVSQSSVLYQVSNNVIIRALSYDKSIGLGSMGINTNDAVLYEAGGVNLKLKEARFMFTPWLDLSFETRLLSLRRFSATLRGPLRVAIVPELTLAGALSDHFDFDLYRQKKLLYVGQAGPVAIWLDFEFSLAAEVGYNVQANATFSTGVRQNTTLTFNVDYEQGRSPLLRGAPKVVPEPIRVIPLSYDINGTATAYATIIPQLDVRVNCCETRSGRMESE